MSGSTKKRGRGRSGRPLNGWLVLDKPVGLTSAQAVARVKRLLDARKVGHTGTLDPLASGVLPLALGEATKLVDHVMDRRKTYVFTLRWGEARTTDDGEGEVCATSDVRPGEKDIVAALPGFTGTISQVPPAYSAIKVNGKRAYRLAREGNAPELAARTVEIHSFQLLEAREDEADFEVGCSKGTYIRALARDLAEALGSAGHLGALRRTRVGPFSEDDAFSLEELDELGHSAPPETVLLSIETPLDDIPAVAVMDSEASRLRHGQAIKVPHRVEGEVLITTPGLDIGGAAVIGLGFVEGGTLRPKRVFNL